MPTISVIMPSLNVARYIDICLESVINQTYTDLEILIIDAGSTDGTLDIIESYAKKDSRIKIIHSNKRSYGYQVNLGLKLAIGRYIGIVDTDDILLPDAYNVLYNVLIKNKLDYVKGYAKAFWEFPSGEYGEFDIARFFISDHIQNKIIQPCTMPELLVKDHFLWVGLYTKGLLQDIRLNETAGAAFQDQGFCLQVFSKSRRAMYIDHAVYLYRQDNANSSTYNHAGLKYIREEYTLNRCQLIGKDVNWYSSFYIRLWDQCVARFEMMAVSGEFWVNAVEDMEILHEMILSAIEAGYLCQEKVEEEKWYYLKLFLKNPRELYEYCKRINLERRGEYEHLLNSIKKENVVIVGGGSWGSFLGILLRKEGVQVKAYCDNNEKLWNKEKNGLIILSLERAVKEYGNAVFVIANKFFSEELKKQLINLKILEKKVYIYKSGIKLDLLR